MLIPSDSKFAAWRWVEVAAFKTWYDKDRGKQVDAVVRAKTKKHKDDPGVPILLEWGDDVYRYSSKHNHFGIYTSVWRYNTKEPEGATLFGPVYFDLDSEDLDCSLEEAQRLYSYLAERINPSSIATFFTGKKGFHIEVEPIPLGVTPSKELPGICRTIGEAIRDELELKTLDFAVYDRRRMWRLANTKHQKTDLYKVELTHDELFSSPDEIMEIAKTPSEVTLDVVDLPRFDIRGNEWYRTYVTQHLDEREGRERSALERRLEAFNKYGHRVLEGPNQRYLDKVWGSVVTSLQQTGQGGRNDTLNQQSFKMFSKVLKSKEADVDRYEANLIDLGVAIGLDEREAEATVNSALRAAKRQHEFG